MYLGPTTSTRTGTLLPNTALFRPPGVFMKLRTSLALLAASASLAATPAAALAQSLAIALSSEPTSADPHYHKQTQNDAFAAHVYDSLIYRGPDIKQIGRAHV